MDFGRLTHVESVDFSLAPLAKRDSSAPSSPIQVFIGTPSWAEPDFARRFYPKGTKTAEQLGIYSQRFQCVELNSSFYAVPGAETLKKWQEASAPHFKFCAKFPRSITHDKALRHVDQDVRDFCERMQLLGDNLGLCFLQLPPTFTIYEGEHLKRSVEAIPPHFPLGIEFRHESWFQDRQIHERVLKFLESHGLSLVVSDVAGRRDVGHASYVGDTLLVRFQGYTSQSPSDQRLRDWALRLKLLSLRGIKRVYFILHELPQNLSLDLLPVFENALREEGLVSGPPTEITSAPGQLDLF